ncbi:MAG: D-glycero-beta-D-manno-heptose-7-phosphate kinase [Bacteroidales bacterium]|nr:D-glycero-beta-D-manno-heptose-7-phosphate kinase [Bacteroidales bacterium]
MNIDRQTLTELFKAFTDKKVMVIGDIMVDSYVWGKVERISPEAPVPVVSVEKREERLGGAANVALNLQSLGAETLLCSVIGADRRGQDLMRLMTHAGLDRDGIIESGERRTTVKSRFIGNNAQLLRVDEESTHILNDFVFKQLSEKIEQILKDRKVDAIIFQDYDKGVISPALIDFVNEKAGALKIPVMVDPKKRNFLAYHNVTLFKPNLKEIKEGLNLNSVPADLESIRDASKKLLEKLNVSMILNTLSEKGVYILWNENGTQKDKLVPAHRRNVADVSGAGDTVISVAALCISHGLNPEDTALLSNLAGGLVCEEVGVVPVNKEKLFEEALLLVDRGRSK